MHPNLAGTFAVMALQFPAPDHPQHSSADVIAETFVNPGFGHYFSDHMVLADWTPSTGWANGRIVPHADFSMSPASAVFHYAQEIFEGLKAYRHADGSVWLFRPDANARRFATSAERMAFPALDPADFVEAVRALVRIDEAWVPSQGEQSLYIRPFMMANEIFLGVRPAKTVTFCVIAGPAGAYFADGVHSVDIWVSTEFARVADGGTGAAKCGGNYAASLAAQRFADTKGCSQVLFVDAATKTTIEELGGMNFFYTTVDNELITPALNGNILAGVTRDSILTIAPELGLTPIERTVTIAEVLEGIDSGHIRSAFACGTAAVVTPIAKLVTADGAHALNDDLTEVLGIRNFLLDIQYGRRPDTYGWTERVC